MQRLRAAYAMSTVDTHVVSAIINVDQVERDWPLLILDHDDKELWE
jgi:hypothetical protein